MTNAEAVRMANLDWLTDLLTSRGLTFREIELIDHCAREGEWTSIAGFFANQAVNPVGQIQAQYQPLEVMA